MHFMSSFQEFRECSESQERGYAWGAGHCLAYRGANIQNIPNCENRDKGTISIRVARGEESKMNSDTVWSTDREQQKFIFYHP